jgi:D-alanyl-D-alanine carboxypeptidase-like protein
MAGKHQRARLTRRARRIVIAGALAVLAVGGVAVSAALRGPAIAIPDDACVERPPLETLEGVTLQPAALAAFRAAQREAGVRIEVVQSYRSCRQQRIACTNICGDPDGCEGTCAPPGLSWHQLGAAVDITQEGLDDERILRALEANGWCQSVPDSDPGHFSFDGCH